VTDAITADSLGFAGQLAAEMRAYSRGGDARVERIARRVLRRPPRPSRATNGRTVVHDPERREPRPRRRATVRYARLTRRSAPQQPQHGANDEVRRHEDRAGNEM